MATVGLLLLVGAHPELFSLATVVDALGADGLLLLLEIQLTGVLLSTLRVALAYGRTLRHGPLLQGVGRRIGDFLLNCGGPVGQYGYLTLATRGRAR